MTTATLAGLVLIGGFVLLLLMRVPISFAMLLATLGSALVTGTNFSVLVRQMVDGANNFSLLSIPFFIVMGEFMSAGGISEKIVDLANLAVGRFRGGLAYVNVLDSMFFGGISGSAVADVSSLGTIVIPMMVKQGYTEDFSVGLTVTTACQGVLIPPSHNMVIYALAAGGVSIGTLFMAGLLPGIALGGDVAGILFRLGEIDGDFQPSRRRIGKITDVLRNRINLDVIARAAHLVEILRRLFGMPLRNALLEVRAYFLWRRRQQPHQARTEEVARIRHILDEAFFDRQIAQRPQKRRRGRRHVSHRHNIAGGGIKLKRIKQQVAEVRHIHRFYQPFCRCVNQQIFNCLCCFFLPRHHQHPFLYSSLRPDSFLL